MARGTLAKESSLTDSALAVGAIPLVSALTGASINAARAGQGNRLEGALRGFNVGGLAGMGGQAGAAVVLC